ncbi:MAG: elongation factor P maturation arginine rhamnosyltransferase EarP [Thiobacillaceae bacterium]
MRTTWDIFCRVIDNYGDIGIAWRLARQLAAEHDGVVRLWIDDLHAFQHLWPAINTDAEIQNHCGVDVRAWGENFPTINPAQVVIEAFGCALPETYLMAMSTKSPPPVWINLEYLSAEPWVTTHHLLPSPHPSLPLTKYFFFPGYQQATGGVLCERDLADRRAQFRRGEKAAFWQKLGLAMPVAEEIRISLFAYQNPVLPDLLNAWATGKQTITCLIPDGKLVPQLVAWLGESTLTVGEIRQRGSLELRILPFLNQDDYDRLLWACDINFVRGEDSCVRAQWAQKPFVWQAYPQPENTHWDKLDALMSLYVQGLSEVEARAVTAMWRAWNGRTPLILSWADFLQEKAVLDEHAVEWSLRLSEIGDLAGNLVDFVEHHEAG